MPAGIQELLGDIQSTEQIQDYVAAKRHYLKGLKKNPYRVSLLMKLSRAQEKLREFDDAIHNLKTINKLDPDNFMAYYRKGTIHIRNNQREDGLECLLKAH